MLTDIFRLGDSSAFSRGTDAEIMFDLHLGERGHIRATPDITLDSDFSLCGR